MKTPLNPYQEMKGASLVEFALIFPLFFGVLFTVIQICLVFVDKASINFVSEELLLEYATDDSLLATDIDSNNGYFVDSDELKNRFKEQLASVQIKYTDPETIIPPKPLILGRICRPDQISPSPSPSAPALTTLKNFESTSPPDNNVLMSLSVNVPINCLMGEITFGLTNDICTHIKTFYRILPLNSSGYPDC